MASTWVEASHIDRRPTHRTGRRVRSGPCSERPAVALRYARNMHVRRTSRPPVPLGLRGESAAAGDHLAFFYETE
jgi:hypothetical protein